MLNMGNNKVYLLKRIDILFFVYLIISSVFLALSWETSAPFYTQLWVRILLLPAVFALIYLGTKTSNSFIQLIRMVYPVILSSYFYSETVFYNKLLFENIDPFLYHIDSAIFGMQPSLEFSAYFSHKLFGELMYFSYFSFYLLIFSFVLYLFLKKNSHFEEVVFKLSASFYIFYFIFSFIPSAGPQFYFSFPENRLPDAYFFNHIMHFIQKIGEQPTGAFPSSHVGISLIILFLSKKYAPMFFKKTGLLVLLLILSTVYIKAHYAVDILAAFLIFPFIVYFSDLIYQIPNSKKSPRLIKKNKLIIFGKNDL